MNDFEHFAYSEICAALTRIESAITPDIYALSFHVFDFQDDPRHPMLQLGFNTEAHCRASSPVQGRKPGWPVASDAREARWNFAFWPQNELVFVGEPDTQGGQLLEQYLRSNDLWFTDEDGEADFDRCCEIAVAITAEFVAIMVRIAQALHANGVIANRFGRVIPIIVHELEYYEQIAIQTNAANPPGVALEFVDWVDKLGTPFA